LQKNMSACPEIERAKGAIARARPEAISNLAKEADANLKSATGATALVFATTGGHAPVAEFLKSKGAK
jgi:hypothetical protein